MNSKPKKDGSLIKNIVLACVAGLVLGVLLIFFYARKESAPATVATTGAEDASKAGKSDTASAGKERRRMVDIGAWRSKVDKAKTKEDFRALMQSALEIEDASLRQAVVTEAEIAWMNYDARDFSSYFLGLDVIAIKDETPRRVLMESLKEALPNVSPKAASSGFTLLVIKQFSTYFAEKDPEGTLQWANQWLAGEGLDTALVWIAMETARKNPEAGKEIANQVKSPLERIHALYAVGSQIGQVQSAEEAIAWPETLTNPTEEAMTLNSVLISVAQKDPNLASKALLEAQKRMQEAYELSRKADLAAANLKEEDMAEDTEAYREAAEAGAIPPPSSPDIELLETAGKVIATKLAQQNPAQAVEWAESINHNYLKLKCMVGVLNGWSEVSPRDAYDFYKTKYGQYDEMLSTVFFNWAGVNADEAAAKTREVTDPTQRELAVQTVAKAWISQGELQTLTKWVDSLPASEKSESLQYLVVDALRFDQPEESWTRAQAIQGERMKTRALKSAFAVLVTEKPEKARQLLASASLSKDDKDRLKEMLDAVTVSGN